jgi:hypothetical protein
MTEGTSGSESQIKSLSEHLNHFFRDSKTTIPPAVTAEKKTGL